MSRFIPEGKSDLNSLQVREKAASSEFQEQQEENETLSLYDQMKLNYIKKEEEYEEKLRLRNQSNTINDRDLRFYQSLSAKKESSDKLKKLEIEKGIEEFEQLKKIKEAKEFTPSRNPITPHSLDTPSSSILSKRKRNSLKGIVKKKKPIKNKTSIPKEPEPKNSP